MISYELWYHRYDIIELWYHTYDIIGQNYDIICQNYDIIVSTMISGVPRFQMHVEDSEENVKAKCKYERKAEKFLRMEAPVRRSERIMKK